MRHRVDKKTFRRHVPVLQPGVLEGAADVFHAGDNPGQMFRCKRRKHLRRVEIRLPYIDEAKLPLIQIDFSLQLWKTTDQLDVCRGKSELRKPVQKGICPFLPIEYINHRFQAEVAHKLGIGIAVHVGQRQGFPVLHAIAYSSVLFPQRISAIVLLLRICLRLIVGQQFLPEFRIPF